MTTSTHPITAPFDLRKALQLLPASGGRVEIPPGVWELDGAIALPGNVILWGHGPHVSVLKFTHDGDGLVSSWPINQSSHANISCATLAFNAQI
jgi:hypothetical protein